MNRPKRKSCIKLEDMPDRPSKLKVEESVKIFGG
jgi:hypothetical protein